MRPCLPILAASDEVRSSRSGIVRLKTRMGWAVACMMVLATVPSGMASTDARKETLQSINWVENPRGTSKPGRHGELGPYQFRSRTWAMHTRRPFSEALNRVAAEEVAIIHYEWIKAGLLRAGLAPSAYNIALAWNAGVSAVVNGRAPAVSHDYARRVSNLTMEQLRGKQVASN